ncbi:MAG: response regulator transcription factor [Candidatus Omnitrophica bacterium]|nr:response regulator transcription factor [Candidatus Omnitrophota bacterium]
MEKKILVVEDEKNIVETVKYNLEKDGYRVTVCMDGESALKACMKDKPDLVVLDLMLPKLDGLEVCRALREAPETRGIAILMLTAKAEEADKIVGLELGADDYMTKPFSPRELVARVKAILRRSKKGVMQEEDISEVGKVRVDWGKYKITVDGKTVTLTAKEFALLRTLLNARGRVLTRDALLERVWGYERSLEIETRTVDLHVSQLRRKLGEDGKRILTVKNVGYRFVLDE